MTPVMKQYQLIKKKLENNEMFTKDCIIFFRLGDFFEIFDDNAIISTNILNITLTKRGDIPMCGVPVDNAHFYIKKLLQANKKVAICDQIETPEDAKLAGRKILNREIIKIYTPGTYNDINNINNTFILAILEINNEYITAYTDVNTGELYYQTWNIHSILSNVKKISPVEIIVQSEKLIDILSDYYSDIIQVFPFKLKHILSNETTIIEYLYSYLKLHKHEVKLSQPIRLTGCYMKLGTNTLDNIDINSLFNTLDMTQTPMGRRFLKSALCNPLSQITMINNRLLGIDYFINIINNKKVILDTGDILKYLNYLKTPFDFIRLSQSISNALDFLKQHSNLPFYLQQNKFDNINIHKIIDQYIEYNDNNYSFSQHHSDLYTQQKHLIDQIEQLSLKYNFKIKNNNLIGYFFEINNTNKRDVPINFILKQGLVSFARYTNSELIDIEIQLNQIRNQIQENEKIIMNNLLAEVDNARESIVSLGLLIGELDFLISCAYNATKFNYCKPEFITIGENQILDIIEGRHPIIEGNVHFISNNCNMSTYTTRNIILTGPNMGGKSIFLKQNALIILMSHCGMWIPAKNCKLSIFDGLFVRAGARDDSIKALSTFMFEMSECANMLHEATYKSFLILDEVGRGTSNIDGISISTAIVEYIHDVLKSLAIIATHYHRLCKISDYSEFIKNYTPEIYLQDNKVTYLYKIIPGISNDSYGIQAAELAGLDPVIIERSQEIRSTIISEIN